MCRVSRPGVHLLHGTGSDGDFVGSAFGQHLADAGYELHAPTLRSGRFEDYLRSLSDDCAVAGGISLGAHAAAWHAASSGWRRPLILVMPAWTGPPGAVAAATLASGEQIATLGVTGVLDGLDDHDWVVQALRRAWANYEPDVLAAALRDAATTSAPDPAQLAAIRAPTLVIGLADDPLHPVGVAEQWHSCIPGSQLIVEPRDLSGAGPRELGRVSAAWLRGLTESR